MSMTNRSKPTEIIINHFRNLDNSDATIAGLKTVADRHASVVREQLRSGGDFQPVADLPAKLLAASLQAMVVDDLLSGEANITRELAEAALEQVDWSEVVACCVKGDDDAPKSIAA